MKSKEHPFPLRISTGLAFILAILLLPTMQLEAAARHPARIARQGSFETLTDVNGRDLNGNATNNNVIERFVMSADGSTAVYSMTQNPLAAPCTFARQIRRVDIATSQDVLIGGCTENLRYQYNSFDVSDDGSRIVYIREDVAENPEIVSCDYSGGSCPKTILLQLIANGPASSLWISPHDADNEQGSLVLSGDGSKIFFRNYFTWLSPGRYSGPITMYLVDAVSGVPSAMFTFTDLATASPPLRENTSFIPSLHAVDYTGSTMVFDTKASFPIVGWHDVSVIDTSAGLSSIKSIAQNTADSCCAAATPDISSDGRKVAYVQQPGGAPISSGGVHVQAIDSLLDPAGPAFVIDSSSATKAPVNPCLSGDGTTVGLFDDATNSHDFRMAPADGSALFAVTRPVVEVNRSGNTCGIPADGNSLLLYGAIRTEASTSTLPWELLCFRWQTSPNTPSVTGIAADPTEWFARDSFTLHPRMYTTFFWEAAFAPSGEQLGRAYTSFLSTGAEESDHLAGENSFYGFLDDDGDGTYEDDFFWVTNLYVDTLATLRFGIAASNGTATHVDVDVDIFDEAVDSDQGFSFGTTPKSVGTVTFVFDDTESGDITVQRFAYPPPNSIGSEAEFWRIFSGSPQGFYGGGGITTAPYSAVLTFEYSQVTNPSLISLYRTLDGLTWVEIPSSVNPTDNEITTVLGQSDVDGLWAIGEGVPVLPATVFSDGFESGDLSIWAN